MGGGEEGTGVEDARQANFSDIFQGDGADTISECSNDDKTSNIDIEEENEGAIPVLNTQTKNQYIHEETTPVWFDHYEPLKHSRKRNVKTLKRDNKFAKCDELPVISVPNMRSLFPKINNFIEDIRMRSIGAALCSETWHKEDKKKHKAETERLLFMEGFKFLSTPRPPGKRGGGCGIVGDLSRYTLDKIEINNPHKLEVCWGMLRPNDASKLVIKEYIICSFYCPPKSRKKEKLITHIITNTHKLLTRFSKAGLFIGGDKNSLNLAPILQGLPRCRQVVTENTHGDKCIDVLITNIANLYQSPEVVPAVQPDDPTRAKPSDHLVPVMYPLSGATGSVSRTYATKTTRPLPDSGLRSFGQWLVSQDWAELEGGPDQILGFFNQKVQTKFHEIFPEKTFKISNEDLPFIDWKLKKMKRNLMRVYRKEGKSDNYQILLTNYERKFQKASKDYIQRNVSDLKSVNPARAAKILKRLGSAPGDCSGKGGFSVVSHQTQNLSPEECTAKILKYFTDISKEYEPLEVCRLPVRVKVKLLERSQNVPTIEDYQVFDVIKKSKKSGAVPGDLPSKLVKEFAAELATPVGIIFRSILEHNLWPVEWAIEHGLALKKVQVPETEADLRIISLSAFWSKCMESFVIDWLDKAIGSKIDFTQYGGLKGQSTSHYLIDMVNFILFNQDLRNPHATLAVLYDFSKAFNRQDHNTLIIILSDMGTPGWLLKLVMAFLTDRKMILRYKGCTSDTESLPGGGPQGTKLGLYLFLILINYAGLKPNQICKNIGEVITRPKRVKIDKTQEKYIDDMTQCVAINLKNDAKTDPNPTKDLPKQYHERTGHFLPADTNPIQEQVDLLKKYAHENKMKLNEEKTKIMLFNRATSIDVLPLVKLSEDHFIELVEETKLLGIMIRSDMSWKSNTNALVTKGFKRIWMLRNLKKIGANDQQLIEIYIQQVRSILEMASPVWTSGLTRHEIKRLERVQKTAVAVIRGDQHSTYEEGLAHLNLKTLEIRREELNLKFAIKSFNHPKFTNWFKINQHTITTRSCSGKLPLKKAKTRTAKFMKSPIPYLTGLLNTYLKEKEIHNQKEWIRIITRVTRLSEQSL